jgi:hypothetical protein
MEIRQFIDDTDPDLACYLPSGLEFQKLQKVMSELKDLESVTLSLQDPKMTLSDVRLLFDEVLYRFPSMVGYLSKDATIVHSYHFENGIVKVLDDKEDQLVEKEKSDLECFLVSNTTTISEENRSPCHTLSFAQNILFKRQKLSNSHQSLFCNLKFVSPTSNIVERLFSGAR